MKEIDWKTYSKMAPKIEEIVLLIKPELRGKIGLFNEVGKILRGVIIKNIEI